MMMFFLVHNVLPQCLQPRRAYCEASVTILPREAFLPYLITHPRRRVLFRLTHYVGQLLGLAHAEQEVNMIFCTAHRVEMNIQAPQRAADVIVKTVSPIGVD